MILIDHLLLLIICLIGVHGNNCNILTVFVNLIRVSLLLLINHVATVVHHV